MNVLFVVWELDPFFKVGGLGDVARSLPAALKAYGTDIRIVLPYYKVTKFKRVKRTKKGTFTVTYNGKREHVEIWEATSSYTNVPAYFLKNSKYLSQVDPMDTWAFFDLAVVEMVQQKTLEWQPDIIHVNDLHCGLIPLLVKNRSLPVKTILTIHNLAFQGKTSVDIIKRMGIDPSQCKMLLWEIKKAQINFLLEGIVHADIITTVSPSYAKEILTEEYGCGLQEILRGKEGKIFGILNGIDITWRYIKHDRAVKFPYGMTEEQNGKRILDWKEGKRKNKEFLQRKLKLKINASIPLFSFIGRLDAGQKGLDILHSMLRRIDQTKIQFILLGSGNRDWEERFHWLSTFYPKNISCNFKFDETLAHQIYAASDFILIPSKYEPCGLIQMIAMLFGTIPIAHKVGGLKDSIKDEVNGLLFSSYSSEVLERTVEKAIAIRKDNSSTFTTMIEKARETDFSWAKSAKQYLSLYEKLLAEPIWTSEH